MTSLSYFPLRTELVASAILLSIGQALLYVAIARIVLRPTSSEIRLVHLPDAVAQDLYRRVRNLVFWTLIGRAIFGNIADLRVPPGIFAGLERLWGLVILAMVLIWLARYRTTISNWIRGSGDRFAIARQFASRIWFPVAALYAISAYFVWALEVYQGFELLARGGVLSVLIVFAIQPIGFLLRRWLDRVETAEATGTASVLQSRYQRYAALAQLLVSGLLYVLAGLAIAYAWGMQPLAWLSTNLSGQLTTNLGDIAFVGLICWGIWEIFDLWAALYVNATDETGSKIQRSARARTLLPLLRTLVVVSLAIAFIVASLTSIGLDVAPLLATAGVVGIAVGFGAQKLVQDVINGLFILFQNTIRVGDIVELAGHAGMVERITVRTLELRDLEGALHTIPFSSVSTVKNMTRDFAFALFDIGVAYREDTDHVMEVLRQLGAEFELDPTFGPDLLGALEMFGVQELGDSAVTIRCRFRVRPPAKLGIHRQFLRRVKRRFDELGIEIPFPQTTLHWAGGGPAIAVAPAAAQPIEGAAAEPVGDARPTTGAKE